MVSRSTGPRWSARSSRWRRDRRNGTCGVARSRPISVPRSPAPLFRSPAVSRMRGEPGCSRSPALRVLPPRRWSSNPYSGIHDSRCISSSASSVQRDSSRHRLRCPFVRRLVRKGPCRCADPDQRLTRSLRDGGDKVPRYTPIGILRLGGGSIWAMSEWGKESQTIVLFDVSAKSVRKLISADLSGC